MSGLRLRIHSSASTVRLWKTPSASLGRRSYATFANAPFLLKSLRISGRGSLPNSDPGSLSVRSQSQAYRQPLIVRRRPCRCLSAPADHLHRGDQPALQVDHHVGDLLRRARPHMEVNAERRQAAFADALPYPVEEIESEIAPVFLGHHLEAVPFECL